MTGKLSLPQRIGVAAADLLMLLLGLYGALFSFLTAFPLPVDEIVLFRACLLAAPGVLAVFSIPKLRYRLPLILVCLGSLGWAAWKHFSSLVSAALISAEEIGAVFVRKLDMGLVAPDFSEELGVLTLAERQELCTFLCLLFLALLALWLGWAVVRRRSFWLTFWGTFPILLAPLSITVTPLWLPLMALVLFWAAGLLTRLVHKADPWGWAKLTLAVLPLTALFLFALGFALPETAYESAEWIPKVRAEALDNLSDLGHAVTVSGGLTGLVGGSAEVDLSHAGPLRYTGSTVLRVESEITGHIYLRGFSAGKYTDQGWEQLDESAYDEMRDGWTETYPQIVDPLTSSHQAVGSTLYNPAADFNGYVEISHSGIGDAQPMNFPALADQAAHPETPARRFTIEGVGLSSGYMYTPYQLATTPDIMTGAEFVNDAYLARDMGIRRYVLYARTDTYDGLHRPATPDSMAESAYQDFVYRNYLGVPEELENTFDQLLSKYGLYTLSPNYDGPVVYGQVFTPPSMAELVATCLAQETEYDPDTPVTPAGEDFVEYFLTTSKRGYCMHYASAATLLLRYLGVPARYVAGYTADVKANETVTVPDQSAHAWVEVYFAGYGWIPVEVTPGFAHPRTEGTATTPSPAAPSNTPSNQEEPSPSRVPDTPVPSPGGESEEYQLVDTRYLFALALILLLAGLLAARRMLILAWRRHKFLAPDVNRAVIAMYLYQQQLARFHRFGSPDPVAKTLGQKAMFSQHTLTDDERQEMLRITNDFAAQTADLSGRLRGLILRYLLALI